MKKKFIIYIFTVISLINAGWDAGGGRATNSFDSNLKLSEGDTLKMSWQASEEIGENDDNSFKNSKYKIIVTSVKDLRKDKNLIGICTEIQPNVKIHVKDFQEWIRSAIQSELDNYCYRKNRKGTKLFVDVIITKFIIEEKDRHYGTAEIELILKHENNSNEFTHIGTYKYDTWGKTLNPYLYQKAISNIVVKIAESILSISVD